MIFCGSATLQAPGEPLYCFDMGPTQILALVRIKVLRCLHSSLSMNLGSRPEKQLAEANSTAGLVQGRSKKRTHGTLILWHRMNGDAVNTILFFFFSYI